ncbi:MAG: DUF2971 domain-containing protein [Bacteroidetes bacterium]|nr:DUF2971 domain-containing protein [Bacteroidota bacterium]
MSKLKTHPHFDYPEDPCAILWRYMDFTKFVSLLEDSALFMTRADKFKDPFEGTITSFDKANRYSLYDKGLADILPIIDHLSDLQRERSYVNCWHCNEFESAAMWDLYVKSNEGIAIKTTLEALSDSITSDQHVWIGNVEYIDFNNAATPRGNHYYPMFLKRKSFEHEKEVRVFYGEHPNDYYANKPIPDKPKYQFGFKLPVDLNILIQEIYISPNAATWLYELVLKVKKRYEIEARVVQSDLYKSPLH